MSSWRAGGAAASPDERAKSAGTPAANRTTKAMRFMEGSFPTGWPDPSL